MAENRIVTMRTKVIRCSEILRIADEKRIIRKQGAGELGVSERQSQRLLACIWAEVRKGSFRITERKMVLPCINGMNIILTFLC